MEFTTDELVLLNNYLNTVEDAPVAITELNARLTDAINPMAPQPEVTGEEIEAPAEEEEIAPVEETPAPVVEEMTVEEEAPTE